MNYKKLVVIPSDPIEAYERKGLDWLERYYNPAGYFDEVYALSPYEKTERLVYGLHIKPVREDEYKRVLESIRPNVVRAYGGYWACDLACYNKLEGIPVVVSVHDTNIELLYDSIKYADTVLCMSNAVADLVRSRGVTNDKIKILPNRIDHGVFFPRTKEEYLPFINVDIPSGKHILHIGRKTKQKNIETVVSSLVFLPEEYSVVFVGQGNAEPYINLANDKGVAHRCFWIPSIKNNNLPYWYSWADCFCVPSLWEGFGVVFIEAAACGSIIVTSDIAPMNEYLCNDRSAFLVKDYENPRAIAEAIHFVCNNQEYRNKISQGAISASKPFSREAIDYLEVDIYKDIISNQNR